MQIFQKILKEKKKWLHKYVLGKNWKFVCKTKKNVKKKMRRKKGNSSKSSL